MKCKYKYKVDGRLKPDYLAAIPLGGWIYEFVLQDGIVSRVDVTVPLGDKTQWPTIIRDPSEGVSFQINTNLIHQPLLRHDLRIIQGLLSVFCNVTIHFDNPSVEWIAESDEERKVLKVFSFSSKTNELPTTELHAVSFDLIARSVFAHRRASHLDKPLNFYRRGSIDFIDRNYIEAIYDFYFVLEILFANGKFKTDAVARAFKQSALLMESVKQTLADPGLFIRSSRGVESIFRKRYGSLSAEKVVDAIVKLRGRLHHQTPKRQDAWHPDNQLDFEVDAMLMQRVTCKVVFAAVREFIWDPGVIKQYEALRVINQDLE